MYNEIIVMRNEQVVEYYMAKTEFGVKYGVLVKIDGYNEIRYGFTTRTGKATKTYKTQRGVQNWLSRNEWQQITTEFHKNQCQKLIRKLGE